MIKVTELTYSKKDFKDILRTVSLIQDDAKKMDLDPFPSTADLAIFANKAYSGKDELLNGLPEGWELLTAVRGRKGYFGCLFFNPSQQQVVLAHRGTVPNIPGTLYADLKSVVLNKYTDYMFSAVTLGDDIKRAILDLNQQDGVRFTLTITGHSLGGWISQVTAITLKHLKRQGNEFVRVSNIDEGIHAHTVVFDSPGVQDMAIKIQRDYGRYDCTPYSMFRSLDISTFFMAVNLVNATGFHVGTMYHISSNLVCTPGYKHFLSNVSTHSLENFTKAFEAGNVKVFQVKDWPQGWGERTPVHELEKVQRTHCPKPEGGPSVRYNIGEEDPGTTVGLHRFSEVELDFVNLIRMVRLNKIRESNIETLFGAKSFQDLFPNFAINRKEKTVTLDSELNSKNFVKNIKNALRWFSGRLQDAMEEQKKLTLPSFLLDMFSQECLDSIPDLPDCEDPFGLCEFTKNTAARVLYVQAADCSLEMARIYNILCNGDIDIDQCIFLNLESLLKLNKILTTKGLPLTEDCLNLFIINIGSTSERTLVEEVLKNVFSKFKDYREKKAVIVSHKNSELFKFVKSFEPELAVRCFPLSAQECLEFKIIDLKDPSRRELFSKDFIILGEQAMSLNALLGENCQSSVSIDDVLKPFLKDILTDESFTLNISNNLLKFDQLDVMFSKINREFKMASLTKLLLEETCSLFVSSDVRQLLEPQLQEVPGVAGRVLYISGSSEEDFRQACLENSSIHVAYWLAATDSRLFLKEVYNRSFYLPRKLHTQSLVDLKKLAQKKNDFDLFIFVGVTDKATLMHFLNASSDVEMLFSTNLMFKCFQDSTMAENAEGIDRWVNKHTLEVVKEGGGYLLVWRDSQGSLDSLLPCLSTDSRLLNEEDLCARKVVIISDLPGMGKSTTLTSLSRHLVNSWVLRINLRDRPADITNLLAQMSVESVAHFLAGAGSEPATLRLLRFCLQSQGSRQIHILLDGFDEIRDEKAVEKILKLCHFLKNETTAKIIVTTRDSYKDVLVNRLSTFATIFEEITDEIQLSFLVNFWHSHVVLGQKDERLRLFAQHLYEAAHKKLGDDTIRLIGIPLHMTMLAEAFLQQAEQFSRNAETIPNIIGMNNVYNLFKKFTSVKRDIYFKDKILMGSDVMGGFNNMLYDKITECHCILAFQIIDSEFAKKYLEVITSEDEFKEMNRFGLTQWNRKTHCDFIHRTFAEYFCSQLLVLWLRRENFRYKHLPIEEWFLDNLLTNGDFNVVRKFLDEHLAENPLTADSKLFYNYMNGRWSEDVKALRGMNDKTALHFAVEENNPNIIDFLLGGLATEQTQEAFQSFLLARDSDGYTALKRGLQILYPINYEHYRQSAEPYEDESEKSSKDTVKKIMHKISHLPYELKYNLLLSTLCEHFMYPNTTKLLLECALNEKDREDIQSALDRIEVLDNYFYNYFINQVEKNNTFSVREFISNELESDVERQLLLLSLRDGRSAFDIASENGNLELVKLFTEGNRHLLNSRNASGSTPLQRAVKGGQIDVVDHLLDQGAKCDVVDSYGQTALFLASESGHLLIVKRLLECGADRNYSRSDGVTALRLAINSGNLIIVKYLLINGADINSKDLKGMSALMISNDIVIIKHLLECKADVHLEDNTGRTALSYAAEKSLEKLQYLIKYGADVNSRDHHGKTPLIYAMQTRFHITKYRDDMIDYLLASGADVNSKEDTGRTALSFVVEKGWLEAVKIVISYGGNINMSDRQGKTPLIYAVLGMTYHTGPYNPHYKPSKCGTKEEHDILDYLLASGADVNSKENTGRTALSFAAEMGWLEAVKIVTSYGGDINMSDHEGKTPLIYAVLRRIHVVQPDVVKYLVEFGAEVNACDLDGKTPLYYATKATMFYEVVEYLLKSGANVGSDQLFSEIFGENGSYWNFCSSSDVKRIKQIIVSLSARGLRFSTSNPEFADSNPSVQEQI